MALIRQLRPKHEAGKLELRTLFHLPRLHLSEGRPAPLRGLDDRLSPGRAQFPLLFLPRCFTRVPTAATCAVHKRGRHAALNGLLQAIHRRALRVAGQKHTERMFVYASQPAPLLCELEGLG